MVAERALGAPLPESLRSHLLRQNGGEVELEDDDFVFFRILDTSDPGRQARTASLDIVRENELARERRGFQSGAVAIAENGAGDYLVLVREGERLGSTVFFWDHETGALDDVGDVGDLLA